MLLTIAGFLGQSVIRCWCNLVAERWVVRHWGTKP